MEQTQTPRKRHQVVIVGGGFGGVRAAKALKWSNVDVTLIDKTNHHLFQPLLYQVATGVLSPGQIAPALRAMMRNQTNVAVRLADVHGFDVENKQVLAHVGRRQETIPYDTLIVAAGASHSYFGNDQWAPFAPGMKTLDDARRLRSRILSAFELAEQAETQEEREAYLTFAVVGGGPTGVELAGQISQLAHKVLKGEYRAVDSTRARIVIVDGGPAILGPFDERLRERARRDLEGLGVEVITGALATDIDENGITAKHGDETLRIDAKTVVWAAGVAASPLARSLAEACDIEITDRAGRIAVEENLTIPGHPDIFAIGDMVAINGVPGVAQPAIQEGLYAGRVIEARMNQRAEPDPFVYKDKGSMATIGRSHAVAEVKGFKFAGLPAFFAWGVVHIAYLVGWGNRFGALTRWLWTMLARNRRERVVSTAAIEEAQAAQERALEARDEHTNTAETTPQLASQSIGHDDDDMPRAE